MTGRLQHRAEPDHQKRPLNWAADQFLVRRFRSALLQVSGAFRGRADARFNDLARDPAEVDTRMQWTANIIGMVRAQLYAAAEIGPEELRETVRRTRAMCQELERSCLNGFIEEPGMKAVPATSIDLAREAGEAIVAVMEFRETGSESAAEKACREVQDVVVVSTRVLELTKHRRPEGLRAVR